MICDRPTGVRAYARRLHAHRDRRKPLAIHVDVDLSKDCSRAWLRSSRSCTTPCGGRGAHRRVAAAMHVLRAPTVAACDATIRGVRRGSAIQMLWAGSGMLAAARLGRWDPLRATRKLCFLTQD